MPRTHSLSRGDIASLAPLKPTIHRGRFVTVAVYITPDHPNFKSIAVVSKKVAPHAVDRNRIKRRIREVVRLFIIQHNTHPITMIIRATPVAVQVGVDVLRTELETLLARALQTTNKKTP